MTRRCSHCGHNGHNSRTCPNRGVKIFGVRLTDGSSIRKSASMGNLSHYSETASPPDGTDHAPAAADGYASDDFVAGSASSTRDRKKGVAWTEDEHRMFLIGLRKLGKGDWRGIARNYVVSRTPTQVASHAQKFYIRQTNSTRRKRRSSLFDMVPDEAVDGQLILKCQEQDKHENNSLPAPLAVDEECDSMDSNSNEGEKAIPTLGPPPCPYPMMTTPYLPPLFPFPWPYWPGYGAGPVENKAHVILKPVAVHSKGPINVNVGMSKLSLGESNGEPTLSQSLKLAGSDRPSAFHANPSTSRSNMNSHSSPIHAV